MDNTRTLLATPTDELKLGTLTALSHNAYSCGEPDLESAMLDRLAFAAVSAMLFWSGTAQAGSVGVDRAITALMECYEAEYQALMTEKRGQSAAGMTRLDDCVRAASAKFKGDDVSWVGLAGKGGINTTRSEGHLLELKVQGTVGEELFGGRIRYGTALPWSMLAIMPTDSRAYLAWKSGQIRLYGRTKIEGKFEGFRRSYVCPSDWPIKGCYVPAVTVEESDGLQSSTY